jgi:hypothetical protein
MGTLAEVAEAPWAAAFLACIDAFSTLSDEPAARDSAAPQTATAAAEMVSFFAFDTGQGRSRRGASLGSSTARDPAACEVSVSLTDGETTVSAAAGVVDFFAGGTRQGRSCGVSA